MTNHSRTEDISAATVFIEQHLGEALTIADVAAQIGVSSFHFQRLFFATLGESVADYIRRRRLERAAILLCEPTSAIIDVALQTGFDNHSAFSRAFKMHFGLSPSAFRAHPRQTADAALNKRPFLIPARRRDIDVAADLIELPQLWLLYRQQQGVVNGAYFSDRKSLAAEFSELASQSGHALWAVCGAYQGGPSAFSDSQSIGCYGGLFDQSPPAVWSEESLRITAGTWLVFPHYGDYAHLYLTWNKVVRNWLPASDFELRDSWAFETYLVHPSEPDTSHLHGNSANEEAATAQIYLPVRVTSG